MAFAKHDHPYAFQRHASICCKGQVAPQKRMNSRKIPKLGGGPFKSENLCYRFWTFKQGFLSIILKKIAT